VILGRNAIEAAKDRREEVVPVGEWQGEVRVLEPVGPERVELERVTRQMVKGGMMVTEGYARTAALGIVDADGRLLFPGEDWLILQQRSASVLKRIAEAVVRVSSFSDKEVADALGESEGTPD